MEKNNHPKKHPQRQLRKNRVDSTLEKLKRKRENQDQPESSENPDSFSSDENLKDMFVSVTEKEYEEMNDTRSEFIIGDYSDSKSVSEKLKLRQTKAPYSSTLNPQLPIRKDLFGSKTVKKLAPQKKLKEISPLDLSVLNLIDGDMEKDSDANIETSLVVSSLESCDKALSSKPSVRENEEKPLLVAKKPKCEEKVSKAEKDINYLESKPTQIPPERDGKEQPLSKSAPEEQTAPKSNNFDLGLTEDKNSLVFYWFDAFEDVYGSPGIVYLFGKTREGESCCVKVNGIHKNVFVEVTPNNQENLAALKKEVINTFRRHKIKDFGAKIVQRKNCFGERVKAETKSQTSKTHFLKCSFPFEKKEFVLSKKWQGKQNFSVRFLGENRRALELFLLKRGLKGPGWVVVQNAFAQKLKTKFSWCRRECAVASPEQVNVLSTKSVKNKSDLNSFLSTSPKLSVLSISLGTVSSKDISEIAYISAVFHGSIDSDICSSSKISLSSLEGVSCVRPLKGKALPKDFASTLSDSKRPVRVCSSERELLNFFLAKLQSFDPDIVVAHNLHKFHLSLLLSRMKALKVPNWSRICRLKRSKIPLPFPVEKGLCSGRLYVDTWLSSLEFSGEKTYSLSFLVGKLFDLKRVDLTPDEIKNSFNKTEKLLAAISLGCNDAFLVIRLMLRLSVLPLTKQLTQLCGNLWASSLRSKRAERNEFLLLHEFYARKYILPEKQVRSKTPGKTNRSARRKAQYAGGLVLEPKKGFYEKYVLLLDFASLYPSIIKEYNICFTTIKNWGEDFVDSEELPEPDLAAESVLPNLIDRLLRRRKSVKKILTNERDRKKRGELDIRQKALKLVANSIYGCLGFEQSRFYCKAMAQLVTFLGRRNLLFAKQTTEEMDVSPPLKVIYGDTDSIMVATTFSSLSASRKLAGEILKSVNKRYRHMELELDGVFRNLLLLQKKKYAAKVVVDENNTRLETKGIDLVRREWCPLSKKLGKKVLDELLSTSKSREEAVEKILLLLRAVKDDLDNDKIKVDQFVISKALSKDPTGYSNAQSLPHVQVALAMRKEGLSVLPGSHISYVISKNLKNGSFEESHSASVAERAVSAMKAAKLWNGTPKLEVDKEWYLNHQLFPPLARLCVPIPELSPGILADCLGNSESKEVRHLIKESSRDDPENSGHNGLKNSLESKNIFEAEDLPPEGRIISACRHGCLNGFLSDLFDSHGNFSLVCSNQNCPSKGETLLETPSDVTRWSNAISAAMRRLYKKHYTSKAVCDDPLCGFETSSVFSAKCSAQGCQGSLGYKYNSAKLLSDQLHLKSLFDFREATQRAFGFDEAGLALKQARRVVSKGCEERIGVLFGVCEKIVSRNEAYHVDLAKIFGPFSFSE